MGGFRGKRTVVPSRYPRVSTTAYTFGSSISLSTSFTSESYVVLCVRTSDKAPKSITLPTTLRFLFRSRTSVTIYSFSIIFVFFGNAIMNFPVSVFPTTIPTSSSIFIHLSICTCNQPLKHSAPAPSLPTGNTCS